MSLFSELDRAVRTTYVGMNRRLIERQSALAFQLLRNARIKKHGDTLNFDLWFERQPTGYYAPYGQFSTVRKESTVRGSLQWKHAYGVVQIDGPTLRANTGFGITRLLSHNSLKELGTGNAEILFSVIDEQMARVINDMKFMIGTSVYGDGTSSDGNDIIGLTAIIDNSTASYAGLDPSTFDTDPITSNGYWTPHVLSNSGTNRPLTLELLGQMNPRIYRDGDSPDNISAFMNNSLWTNFELLLEGRKRTENPTLAALGYKNIVWDNITFMRDERCPANKIYYVNFNHLYMVLRNSANFEFQGFQKPYDQDAVVGSVITDLQLVCDDRHRLGLIDDVEGILDV